MRLLRLLVFTVGFVTLGVELSASRLLEPAFGNNQIVWAALILFGVEGFISYRTQSAAAVAE